jgi:VCBS repeat-containing protein
MVISADQRQTMNEIFGFNTSIALSPLGSPYGATAAAAGTTFGEGPASLPSINSVYGVSKVSLPTGAVSMFESGDTSAAAVIPFGDGQVTYVGWTWWNLPNYTFTGEAQPWARVLDAAISKASDAVIESGYGSDLIGVPGDPSATGNVLLNDLDPDTGATKAVTAVNGAAANVGTSVNGVYGSLVINADGSYTYSLDNGDLDTNALALGATGHDVFSYTMADQFGAASSSTLSIEVRGLHDAPIAVSDHYTANAGATLTVAAPQGLLANDVDDSGSLMTVQLLGTTPVGDLTVNPDGSFTYTVGLLSGVESFQYRALNGAGEYSNIVSVDIQVDGSAYPWPVARDDSAATNEDTPVIFDVLANDSGSALSLGGVIGATSALGVPVDVVGNVISYNPLFSPALQGLDEGVHAVDTVTYYAVDQFGAVAQATLSIDVVGLAGGAAADDVAEAWTNLIAPVGVLSNDMPGVQLSEVFSSQGSGRSELGAFLFIEGSGVVSYDATALGLAGSGGSDVSVADRFSYTVRDMYGDFSTAVVNMTVHPVSGELFI